MSRRRHTYSTLTLFFVIDQEYLGPPSDWHADVETQSLLDAQRVALHSVSSVGLRQPKVGDVWLSAALWSGGMDEAMTAMLVVLRTFTEAWSARPLFDVAPVSEDERLASEWSLIFGASQSGFGFPIVTHIDAQCTTSSSMLVRFVGALSDVARFDLEAVLRAYALNDDYGVELKVGRRGSVSIRCHPEWEEFAHELVELCQAFSASLERQHANAAESMGEGEEERADYGLLAVASGKREDVSEAHQTTWQYIPEPPFIYAPDRIASSMPPSRVGEALAVYYTRCFENDKSKDANRWGLDAEAFSRLTPFLDVPTEKLFVDPSKVPVVLFELAGQHPAYGEIRVIVNAVRCIKMKLQGSSKPMRLAARRPSSD